VIGGGVAGLQAAIGLAAGDVDVVLVEKDRALGGWLRRVHRTYPELEPPSRYLDVLLAKVDSNPKIKVLTGTEAVNAKKNSVFSVELRTGDAASGTAIADVVVVATGMDPVDARAIPEFGLSKYPDVVTSLGFEEMLLAGDALKRRSDGSPVKTIAFIQCVGSRVEKRGVSYCSALCCSESVKQAILAKEADRSLLAYILYIDLRTTSRGCEAMYKRARQVGVRFVRGQPSMVLRRPGTDKLIVAGENTLAKELYEIQADLVVLSVGLELADSTKALLRGMGAQLDREGLSSHGDVASGTSTTVPGLFVAGCAESPKDVHASIAHGSEAALSALEFLKSKD